MEKDNRLTDVLEEMKECCADDAKAALETLEKKLIFTLFTR